MAVIRKLILDVLKPHQPDIISVAKNIAALGKDYSATVSVIELDKQTETLQIEITGETLDFALIVAALKDMGASLHSVDEVVAVHEKEFA